MTMCFHVNKRSTNQVSSCWCTTRRVEMAEKVRVPSIIKHAKRGNYWKVVGAIGTGESVNSVDREGRSALFFAALNGNKKCLKELLRKGADPNQRTRNGHTPCHAIALGGRTPSFPSGIAATRNPVEGAFLLGAGFYNKLAYHLRDRKVRRRCLEYLVEFGGDLGILSLSKETVRDIAVRMRKMNIVQFIEEYYDLQLSQSGYCIRKGQSMLRPTDSYPRPCPHWMHTVTRSNSLENVSPMNSLASLYQQGTIRNIYDYGFVYSFGSRMSPGSAVRVPETMNCEITKYPNEQYVSIDGTVWGRALWGLIPATIRRLSYRTPESQLTGDHLLQEMDYLANMRHPNIALLMAVCCGPTSFEMCVILEPLQLYSLHCKLHCQKKTLSKEEKLRILFDVTLGLSYLHDVQLSVQCILSSYAVMFTNDNKTKLVNLFYCQYPGEHIGKLVSVKLFLPWMAPELIQTRQADYSCDVYSLGVLLWELWCEQEPWGEMPATEICKNVVGSGHRLPLTEKHKDIEEVLQVCFSQPDDRPDPRKVRYMLHNI